MGKKSPLYCVCKWKIKCVGFSVTEIYINSDFLNDSLLYCKSSRGHLKHRYW